jgi:hypothetical protein
MDSNIPVDCRVEGSSDRPEPYLRPKPSSVSFPDYFEGFLPFFLLDAYLFEQDIGNYGYYTDIIMTEQILFCDNNMTILPSSPGQKVVGMQEIFLFLGTGSYARGGRGNGMDKKPLELPRNLFNSSVKKGSYL